VEEQVLKELYRAAPMAVLEARLERGRWAVYRKAWRMGLAQPKARREERQAQQHELKTLRALFGKGLGPLHVAQVTGQPLRQVLRVYLLSLRVSRGK